MRAGRFPVVAFGPQSFAQAAPLLRDLLVISGITRVMHQAVTGQLP